MRRVSRDDSTAGAKWKEQSTDQARAVHRLDKSSWGRNICFAGSGLLVQLLMRSGDRQVAPKKSDSHMSLLALICNGIIRPPIARINEFAYI